MEECRKSHSTDDYFQLISPHLHDYQKIMKMGKVESSEIIRSMAQNHYQGCKEKEGGKTRVKTEGEKRWVELTVMS